MVKMMPLTIQRRDVDLMTYLARHGFVAGADIRQKFWPTYPTGTNHHSRLRKLIKVGLVAPLLGDLGTLLGYQITPRGRALLGRMGVIACEAPTTKSMYKTAYAHNRLLYQVRDILEGSPLVSNFVTEPELKRALAQSIGRDLTANDRHKVPDGQFTLTAGKRPLVVALELEMTLKRKERYFKSLENLATRSDIDTIFYVTAGPDLTRSIESALTRVRAVSTKVKLCPKYHGFYFASLSDVLENGLNAKFRGEQSEYSLNSLVQNVQHMP